MHPYLRAYLAGLALPSMVVPLVIAVLVMAPIVQHPFHLEDVVIFPIGLAPNAWGLWNMLHLRLNKTRAIPIGLFGAALVFVIAPAAYGIQLALGKMLWTPQAFAVGLPVTLVFYYLAWKHIVGRINALLGVA